MSWPLGEPANEAQRCKSEQSKGRRGCLVMHVRLDWLPFLPGCPSSINVSGTLQLLWVTSRPSVALGAPPGTGYLPNESEIIPPKSDQTGGARPGCQFIKKTSCSGPENYLPAGPRHAAACPSFPRQTTAIPRVFPAACCWLEYRSNWRRHLLPSPFQAATALASMRPTVPRRCFLAF